MSKYKVIRPEIERLAVTNLMPFPEELHKLSRYALHLEGLLAEREGIKQNCEMRYKKHLNQIRREKDAAIDTLKAKNARLESNSDTLRNALNEVLNELKQWSSTESDPETQKVIKTSEEALKASL